MTVKELQNILNKYPEDMEVLTRKTQLLGNIAEINSVREDEYAFFGVSIPCVLLTDELELQESEEEE